MSNRTMASHRVPSITKVQARLRQTYGPRSWQRWGSGISVLVETILSQNTSNANSWAGYRKLWNHFHSWNKVADAPTEEVAGRIRISGLSNIKAPRIQSILRQIREERGKMDLEFLKDLPPDEARRYLLGFKGVGPKTANCVLLFSPGMPVFPVDTHIHRIAMRLGWIPEGSSANEACALLEPMIAPPNRYEMHILLIELGRQVCKARGPDCDRCCLRRVCRARLH